MKYQEIHKFIYCDPEGVVKYLVRAFVSIPEQKTHLSVLTSRSKGLPYEAFVVGKINGQTGNVIYFKSYRKLKKFLKSLTVS